VKYGAFDDRDNARRHVKRWMNENLPVDYTVGNLMGLARKMVADDYEPVDDIRVQWMETSYGLLRGIVEFAADQLAADRSDAGREGSASQGSDSRISQAAAMTWEAAAALPYRTDAARRHLQSALDVLGTPHGGEAVAPAAVQRARQAISLALLMLGTPSGRSVAA
jgi:hypothetical protein